MAYKMYIEIEYAVSIIMEEFLSLAEFIEVPMQAGCLKTICTSFLQRFMHLILKYEYAIRGEKWTKF